MDKAPLSLFGRFRERLANVFGVGSVPDMPASAIVISAGSTKLDLTFFRRLLGLLKPYWWRLAAWPSWLAYGVALGSSVVNSWMLAKAVTVAGDTLNALQARAEGSYWHLTLVSLLISLGAFVFSTVLGQNVTNLLNIHWDQWLTKRLIGIYLSNRTYYDIALHQDIDNPDQRIQNEVQSVVSVLSQLPTSIITPIVSSVLQIGIVMSVSPTMFWVALGYCAVQTAATIYVLRPQVAYQWKATVSAADFRHNLVSVREHSETIAFYGGEASEQRNLTMRLDRSVRAQRALTYYGVFSSGVQQLFSWVWMILPLLVVTPLYFAGKIQIGTIAEATGAAGLVVSNLSSLKNALPTLAQAAPSVVRLADFQERMERRQRIQIEERIPRISYAVGDHIRFENVTVETPDGTRKIVRGLDVELPPHQPLLVVGQTGVGKSSVLRALAGLWTRGEGRIVMPPPHELMFLPQRPYMMLGTLRQQILYPHATALSLTDADLQSVLEAVRLPDLLARMDGADAVRDWRSVLSLGEQQRLGFARILVSRPRLVFLDESTSAVDVETEAALYGLLDATVENFVSVGHRPTLVAYHQRILRLRPDGWCLEATASDAAASSASRIEEMES